MSEMNRITGIYFNPKPVFADIAVRSRWYVPLLLLIVCAIGFMYAFQTHDTWEPTKERMRPLLENNRFIQQIPEDRRQQQIESSLNGLPRQAFIGAIVGMPLYALILASTVLLMTKMMGTGIKFKQMFAFVCYSLLPGIVYSILCIVVVFLKSPEEFNIFNPLAFNLGAFLEPPPSTSGFRYYFATSIDLFNIWTLVLVAMAITVVSRKTGFGKALAAVLVPWLLLDLLWCGFRGLGS